MSGIFLISGPFSRSIRIGFHQPDSLKRTVSLILTLNKYVIYKKAPSSIKRTGSRGTTLID